MNPEYYYQGFKAQFYIQPHTPLIAKKPDEFLIIVVIINY